MALLVSIVEVWSRPSSPRRVSDQPSLPPSLPLRNCRCSALAYMQDSAATAFCAEIKLMYYPSMLFFGSGKFHDHDPMSGVVLGPRPTQHDSSAKARLGPCVCLPAGRGLIVGTPVSGAYCRLTARVYVDQRTHFILKIIIRGRDYLFFLTPRAPVFPILPLCYSSQQFPSHAMVYFENVLDWVIAMNFVSRSNRAMDKLRLFGGSKQSSEERLVAEIEALERQVACLLCSLLSALASSNEYSYTTCTLLVRYNSCR